MVQPLPVPHVGSRLDHRDSSSPDRLRHLFSRCGQPTCRTIIGQSRIRERHDSGECHPMADRPSTQLRSNPRHHRHHRHTAHHLLHHIHHHRLDRKKNRNQRHRPGRRGTGERLTQSRNGRTIRRLRANHGVLIIGKRIARRF